MNGMRPQQTGATTGQPFGARNLGLAIVDPIPLFRAGVAEVVDRTIGLSWAGQAVDHRGAVRLCEQAQPDVVLVDSALDPDCDLVELLSAGSPGLVLIMLLRHRHRTWQYLAGALDAGAHALVPREASPCELAMAVRLAYSRRHYVAPELPPVAPQPKRAWSRRSSAGTGISAPLSEREHQVLLLVAEGLRNAEIARLLFVSVETVRAHVRGVLRKLHARGRTHAVTVAFRNGILVRSGESSEIKTVSYAAAHSTSQ
ncbi:helix-turn-helix transcriptional regulator [Amycolatopsis sp. A1MSW2902]|uniref:response regulator transcription factor n=1 Tax=Amycolatopsis sp. A1MSW2902 TaxID=687413 RepID=UPI00307F94CE